MSLYLKEDDFEIGLIVMVVEEPEDYHVEPFTIVKTPARTFFPEFPWRITGMDLPFVSIRPYNPSRRWDHLGTYVLDTRKYKFKKITPEFAAAATEKPPKT